jgi:hypothetical protein
LQNYDEEDENLKINLKKRGIFIINVNPLKIMIVKVLFNTFSKYLQAQKIN